MPREVSTKQVRDDQHFLRMLESERAREAWGEHAQRWMVRHARDELIRFRVKACAGAYQLSLDDRDAMIVRLRQFKYSTISIPAAAEVIATDLRRYLLGNSFRQDKRRGGPPADDPARAMLYAICTCGARVPESAEQIENVLRGKRTKRRKFAAHAA